MGRLRVCVQQQKRDWSWRIQKFFTLWFFNGAFLKDKKKHLINANEGVTKSLRQWRFTSKEEINEKEILAYILEAIENEKQEKIIKPEKQKPKL